MAPLKKLMDIIAEMERDIKKSGCGILGTPIGAGYTLQELRELQKLMMESSGKG